LNMAECVLSLNQMIDLC